MGSSESSVKMRLTNTRLSFVQAGSRAGLFLGQQALRDPAWKPWSRSPSAPAYQRLSRHRHHAHRCWLQVARDRRWRKLATYTVNSRSARNTASGGSVDERQGPPGRLFGGTRYEGAIRPRGPVGTELLQHRHIADYRLRVTFWACRRRFDEEPDLLYKATQQHHLRRQRLHARRRP